MEGTQAPPPDGSISICAYGDDSLSAYGIDPFASRSPPKSGGGGSLTLHEGNAEVSMHHWAGSGGIVQWERLLLTVLFTCGGVEILNRCGGDGDLTESFSGSNPVALWATKTCPGPPTMFECEQPVTRHYLA